MKCIWINHHLRNSCCSEDNHVYIYIIHVFRIFNRWHLTGQKKESVGVSVSVSVCFPPGTGPFPWSGCWLVCVVWWDKVTVVLCGGCLLVCFIHLHGVLSVKGVWTVPYTPFDLWSWFLFPRLCSCFCFSEDFSLLTRPISVSLKLI